MKKRIALVLVLMLLGTAALAAKTITPVLDTFDPNHVGDCTRSVSFDPEKIVVNADGTATVEVTFYSDEYYDILDANLIEIGDTIVSEGREIVVKTIEETDEGKLINGGYIEGGVTLGSEEDANGAFSMAEDSRHICVETGTATLTVSKDVVYRDTAEVDMGIADKEINVTGVEAMLEGMHFHDGDNHEFKRFIPEETTVAIENGVITEISHRYVQ